MAWVRDGDAPDEVKVSFVVNRANDPELLEWLWGLPFRKQSSVIRDVLSEAVKIVKSDIKPNTEQVRPPLKTDTARTVHATPVIATSNSSIKGTGMTEATANILRNMRIDFE